MLLGLSTAHSLGLALVAGVFIVFALLSSLVIPRRWPEYPGKRLGWFIAGTVVLFVAMLGSVEVFAAEPSETEAATTTETTTTQPTEPPPPGPPAGQPPGPPPPPAAQGNAAAGKTVFASAGCSGCHTFAPAGSTGTIGPDLDEALQGKDAAFIKESIVDPNKVIASGYTANIMPSNFGQSLSTAQVDDLVAFLQTG